jgi:hypothetical protein
VDLIRAPERYLDLQISLWDITYQWGHVLNSIFQRKFHNHGGIDIQTSRTLDVDLGHVETSAPADGPDQPGRAVTGCAAKAPSRLERQIEDDDAGACQVSSAGTPLQSRACGASCKKKVNLWCHIKGRSLIPLVDRLAYGDLKLIIVVVASYTDNTLPSPPPVCACYAGPFGQPGESWHGGRLTHDQIWSEANGDRMCVKNG